SKVSLVDYQAAITADDEERANYYLQRHVKAVRQHIDDLSAKDYSQLPGLNSPGFVMLFMPIEAAFIEALKADEALYHYAFNKNIILTSPTTLLPLLKTVAY
ncbi:DNA recombination protein RmuC, partial [Micrococcus luteus]|nr:DNA recombination protein RmuC [Micrococcus luteus]